MNKKTYGQLLSETSPVVITNQKEYERLEDIFASLLTKKRSPEEDRLFDLLVNLLEDYEQKTLPEIEESTPVEILKFLMNENNLKQKDLISVFGTQSIVSEILSGKRQININQAKRLAREFNLSADLFINISSKQTRKVKRQQETNVITSSAFSPEPIKQETARGFTLPYLVEVQKPKQTLGTEDSRNSKHSELSTSSFPKLAAG